MLDVSRGVATAATSTRGRTNRFACCLVLTVIAAKLAVVALLMQPAAAADPRPTLADPGASARSFGGDAYNVPLSADPVLDPDSSSMVSVLSRTGRAAANLYAYGDPVFEADADTPLRRVTCLMPWGTCDLSQGGVRIPTEASPTPGSDGRMIVIDHVSGQVCDFWQARRLPTDDWLASWGTCASIDGGASGPSGGATGAGINALAGVVRTYEMRQGQIEHALSFATDNSCRTVFRFPATKTDGSSSRSDCIPEGARVQLDPTINVDAIPGITPGEKAVAKALQKYGAYNRDNAGAPMAFSFESPIGEADPYPAAGFAWDYYDMPHIPWNKLRVLRQWDGR